MVSGICVAKHLKVPFVIHWYPRSVECICRFESVLDPKCLPNNVQVVSEELFQAEEVLSYDHMVKLLYTWNRQTDLNIKSYGIFYSDDTWDSVLQSLVPSLSVRKIIEEKRVDWSKAIGIHIRRTDNQKSIEGSPTEWFLEKMRADKESFYVIATDDKKLRTELQDEFGERCLFPASVLSRRSEEGMIHGVVDFFALSKCSKIWGSVGSSFSEIAARYGSIELVRS
jgi:hypothetical protein